MARYSKHLGRLFLPLCLSALMLLSCQEGGDAGELFGQWRMTDTDRQYIAFSGSLVLFRSIQEGQVFGKFQHVGDSLFIQAYSINNMPLDTAIVEKTFGFTPFTNIRVGILTLNDEHLVLSKGHRKWSFDKY